FFFTCPAPTQLYTLSLHDALPISLLGRETQVLLFGDLAKNGRQEFLAANVVPKTPTNNLPGTIVTRAVVVEKDEGKWSELLRCEDRKSTRLNSSHLVISYAVFCLT